MICTSHKPTFDSQQNISEQRTETFHYFRKNPNSALIRWQQPVKKDVRKARQHLLMELITSEENDFDRWRNFKVFFFQLEQTR